MSTGSLSGIDPAAQAAAEAAARKAAEEAARRAAEEAARRAAEEAARKAAEDAARRASDQMARSAAADGRMAGYAPAPEATQAAEVTGTQVLPWGHQAPADAFMQQHAEAVARLPADQQEKLRTIVGTLCDPATQKDSLAARTFEDLGNLVEAGVLAERDTQGKTILDHIEARLNQPVHPDIAEGLNRAQEQNVLHEIIRTVAHPGAINQGEGTYTCTTAVVQQLLARAMPADYVGMATGFIFDGVARTPTGETIALDTAELYERELGLKTGRGAVDAIFQGSLLAYAQKTFEADGVTSEGGRFSASFTFGGGRFSVRAIFGSEDVPGGLTAKQVGGLLEKVFGIKTTDIEVTEENRETAFGMFTASLERARSGDASLGSSARVISNGIPVGVQTQEGKFHEILVRDIKDGRVTYVDPVDGKEHEIPESDFKANLVSIKVPVQAPSRFARSLGDLDPDSTAARQAILYGLLRRGFTPFATVEV